MIGMKGLIRDSHIGRKEKERGKMGTLNRLWSYLIKHE